MKNPTEPHYIANRRDRDLMTQEEIFLLEENKRLKCRIEKLREGLASIASSEEKDGTILCESSDYIDVAEEFIADDDKAAKGGVE